MASENFSHVWISSFSADSRSMVSNVSMRFRWALAAVLLLCAVISNGRAGAAQPGDFGFRFEVADCFLETFDTFSGVFTKDIGGDPARIVTAQIFLPDSQMRDIHQTIQNIRFFDYPSKYSGVPAGIKEVRTTSPAYTYRLEVHAGGTAHTVWWKDAYKPTTVEADRLRDLLRTILSFIHSHPNFKRLPAQIGGCY